MTAPRLTFCCELPADRLVVLGPAAHPRLALALGLLVEMVAHEPFDLYQHGRSLPRHARPVDRPLTGSNPAGNLPVPRWRGRDASS